MFFALWFLWFLLPLKHFFFLYVRFDFIISSTIFKRCISIQPPPLLMNVNVFFNILFYLAHTCTFIFSALCTSFLFLSMNTSFHVLLNYVNNTWYYYFTTHSYIVTSYKNITFYTKIALFSMLRIVFESVWFF